MTRSKWKPIYNINKSIYNQNIVTDITNLKTYSRNLTLTSFYLNYTFLIYTGIIFKKIIIEENMLGFKLGEFAPTRLKPRLNKKLKNKLKKKR
jgi:small subunit ribosomal protein S19